MSTSSNIPRHALQPGLVFAAHPDLARLLREFNGKASLRILEIGTFEGRSTCWQLENIVMRKHSNPTSRPGATGYRYMQARAPR